RPDDDRLIAEINALRPRLRNCETPIREITAIRILGAAIRSRRDRARALSLANTLEGGTCGVEISSGSSSGTFPLRRRNNDGAGSSGSSGQSSSSGSSGSSGNTSGGTSGASSSSSSGSSGQSSGSSGSSGASGNTSGGTSGASSSSSSG